MKNNFKKLLGGLALLAVISSCNKTDYTMGEMTVPSELKITTSIVGADATHPTGDSSGLVKITMIAKDAIAYRVDYDANNPENFDYISSGTVTHRYTDTGLHTYTITAMAQGKGGLTKTLATTTVTVYSKFLPDPALVTKLTNNEAGKTWVVDKSIPAHFGVGPIAGSSSPDWWSAGINEKAACCNCFYTTTFNFKQNANGTYTLTVSAPDGVFTKGAPLTTVPTIPTSIDEKCFSGPGIYSGGTSSFALVPAASGIDAAKSTQTAILLDGNNTYIGYGAVKKEFEILKSDDAAQLYLRVQGTETGNAWYMRLKSL